MYKGKRLRDGTLVMLLTFSLLLSNMTALFAAVPEGETIAAISVKGNSVVAESAILAVIQAKPGDKVDSEAMKKDMKAIYDLGYFFDVATDFTQQENGVGVIYQVIENPIVSEIIIKGNTVVPTAKIMDILQDVNGAILNSRNLEQGVRQIEAHYHDQGYILAKVSDVGIDAQGVVAITVNEGLLEGIAVKGNDKTKDYVITREMTVKPGQPFNVRDARRSMQKIYNLGYFEDVNMKLNPGMELNGVVLEADVKEQRTGTFGIGGGYSDTDGLVAFIELGDNNFRGTGDQVKIHWEFGGDTGSNNYMFGFTRPWLDKKQTSLSLNIYNITREKDEYEHGTARRHYLTTFDENREGFNITLGRPKGEYRKNYVTFKRETVSNEGVTRDTLPDPRGDFGTTHSVTLQSVWDTRDNVFNATEGVRVSLSTEFAGSLMGGDFDFQKYQVDGRKYIKVDDQHVWALRLGIGFATGDLPESEEFSVGGGNTLRGYRDYRYEGKKMILGSAEYRFPLTDKVQGVGFVDAGQASDSFSLANIEASVGVGIRLTTPIGPIRLDYGVGSEGGRVSFSMGSSF